MQATLSCTDPRCHCVQHRRSAARAERELEWEFEFEFEISRSGSEYIRWVQSQLNRLIGAALVVDGVSGTLTRSAVRSFQQRAGVAVDGVVGPVTEAALLRAGATPPPGGAPASAPAPAPVAAPGTLLSVPESSLISRLPAFLAYRYTYGTPSYPEAVNGVPGLRLRTPAVTNCCSFCEGLLVPAWDQQHRGVYRWSLERHSWMMVYEGITDRRAPQNAVVAARMASHLPDGQAPGAWCLAQGWTAFPKGHQFIVVARHAATDKVLTLEANTAGADLDGVGCRGLGPLRDMPGQRPPPRWWTLPEVPTWSAIRGAYTELKLAQLAVTQPSWAGI